MYIKKCQYSGQKLHNENEIVDINFYWKDIKEAVNCTCEEVFGRRKPDQKDWISEDTNRKIQERNVKKVEPMSQSHLKGRNWRKLSRSPIRLE